MEDSKNDSHIYKFLKHERQIIEKLRKKMGTEVISKFDKIILREFIYEFKEQEIEDILGIGAVSKNITYPVMITMKSGKFRPFFPINPIKKKEQMHFIKQMENFGKKACQRIATVIKRLNVEIKNYFWLTHSVVAELTSKNLEKIAARNDVKSLNSIKPQLVLTLEDSRLQIQADQVENNLGYIGTGIEVAVLDTGVDINHPALAGIVIDQQDFTGEGIGDNNGHGTHCSGIIASQDSKYRGISPGVHIRDFKIIDGFGESQPDWAIQAIQSAVAAGVDVMSNSWGFSHASGFWEDLNCSCVLCTAADNAVTAGVVFLVAAGNENNDTCQTYDTHIRCPGNACEVITVGAVDKNDSIAEYSSIGPTVDGRTKPDIVAPGTDIVSCRANGTGSAGIIDDNWIKKTGTSMACPHVAGVVALMLEKNKALTPPEVKKILMSTAVDIGTSPNEMGAGRVNALSAVNSA